VSARLHVDMPFGAYRALDGWNWSTIKHMSASPRHVHRARTAPDDDTPARGVLRAIHALVLEPHRFDGMFAVYEGRRDARSKEYQAFLGSIPDGCTVLTPRELSDVQTTAEAIRSHPVVAELLAAGEPEVVVEWTDEATGLPMKGRLDWCGPAGVVDLKTIGTTCPRAVASMVARHGWHGQAAHYSAGLEALGQRDVPYVIIAAEGKGAQDVAVYELDRGIPDGALHVGAVLRRRLLDRLAECVRLDEWPGRHPGRQVLCLPQYALEDGAEAITIGEEE
jgi:hypothetical protein